jgi:Xaa-Pro aminopeptidase
MSYYNYYNEQETANRIVAVKHILEQKGLDAALIYFDELNIADGWYLTGWCPQFEKGAVLLPLHGDALLLGGPESEPFAIMSSAIKKTRNFSVFMVPDEEYPNATIIDFAELYEELREEGCILKKVGIVGMASLPHNVYTQFEVGFKGVELVDITADYQALRYRKSPWEVDNIRKAFVLAFDAYKAMEKMVKPGVFEYEVAAEGEYLCRRNGASSFAFSTIIASGVRTNAVVPTAINKRMEPGEWAMIGLAPRINGYAGTFSNTLPVSGEYTKEQKDCINILREAYRLTRAMLKPGMRGIEIDAPARKLFTEAGLIQYLVCPFAHTVGLMEAESPFFGPNGADALHPGMTVCIDVSFFGHPTLYGARIESGFVITEDGCEPLCREADEMYLKDL